LKALLMMKRLVFLTVVAAAMCSAVPSAQNSKWNSAGLPQAPPGLGGAPAVPAPESAPAPKRDLTGIWDPGGAGVGARGMPAAPLTPWGDALGKTHHSGDGARMVPAPDINDPLSTLGDPSGFPRNLLFELRPVQVVQTPNEVLMLYMFEKRWRNIWTDGRQLPKSATTA